MGNGKVCIRSVVHEGKFMTRGDEDIEGELWKFLDTRKGGSEKIVGLEGGLQKFVYFKANTRGRGAPRKLNC